MVLFFVVSFFLLNNNLFMSTCAWMNCSSQPGAEADPFRVQLCGGVARPLAGPGPL